MLTLNSAATMLNVMSGQSVQPVSLNEDVIAHQLDQPLEAPAPFPVNLLPGFIRRPLMTRIAARQYERSLLALWNVSPHLLDDIGVVLNGKAALPDHLIAAPARLIDHVAAIAPEQILAAELRFPQAKPAVRAPITGRAVRDDGAFPLASAT